MPVFSGYARDTSEKIAALDQSLAVIEFDLDGTILHANTNFLNVMGYTLDEIEGKHHSLFVEPSYRASQEYQEFWHKLGEGKFHAGEYMRLTKSGKAVWIEATYNPVFKGGRPYKVIKLAQDITAKKLAAADSIGQLQALHRSQAVIEFNLDGTIITANDNFLNTLGYSLAEIQGKHHSMFVDPEYRTSTEYKQFWEKLSRGEFHAGEYKRITKAGQEIWIQATYNPIYDSSGRLLKVVKFATDVTEQKMEHANLSGKITAIDRSQAVIEFNLDGTIITANDNFLKTVGYSLAEIQGKHHSMFVEPEYRISAEYKKFWEKLSRGEFHSGEYKRTGKGGKEIWIQASYNPIFDLNGKPYKVVKYATDLTPQKEANRKMADDFEMNVKSLVDQVILSTTDMQATSQTLAAVAEETSSQSAVVATSTEQLSSAVNEISKQLSQSTVVIHGAVNETKRSAEQVDQLLKAAEKIGAVVQIIKDIAAQTNLLSLNATIEAASAGDAGKGFAVVANEVKQLAKQTSEQTREIEQLIQDIQKSSQDTASTIHEIEQSISQVSDISTSISAAVEEQSSATKEVARTIVGVMEAANETGRSSSVVLNASDLLHKNLEELDQRVDGFLSNVRKM